MFAAFSGSEIVGVLGLAIEGSWKGRRKGNLVEMFSLYVQFGFKPYATEAGGRGWRRLFRRDSAGKVFSIVKVVSAAVRERRRSARSTRRPQFRRDRGAVSCFRLQHRGGLQGITERLGVCFTDELSVVEIGNVDGRAKDVQFTRRLRSTLFRSSQSSVSPVCRRRNLTENSRDEEGVVDAHRSRIAD